MSRSALQASNLASSERRRARASSEDDAGQAVDGRRATPYDAALTTQKGVEGVLMPKKTSKKAAPRSKAAASKVTRSVKKKAARPGAAKKRTVQKGAAKKSAVKKSAAKKSAVKKSAAKNSPAPRAASARKAPAASRRANAAPLATDTREALPEQVQPEMSPLPAAEAE